MLNDTHKNKLRWWYCAVLMTNIADGVPSISIFLGNKEK